jgi:hypothetical protein
MATKIVKSARTDPRYLLRKSIGLMSKTLTQLTEAAGRKAELSPSGGIIIRGGLTDKEIDSLISLSRALHAFARQADADDMARVRQLKGMTDEQLAEMEKRLASAEHSEAVKEGIRNARLAKELNLEENEDGEEDGSGD